MNKMFQIPIAAREVMTQHRPDVRQGATGNRRFLSVTFLLPHNCYKYASRQLFYFACICTWCLFKDPGSGPDTSQQQQQQQQFCRLVSFDTDELCNDEMET